MNNINSSVITEIVPLSELFIVMFSGLNQTFFPLSLAYSNEFFPFWLGKV